MEDKPEFVKADIKMHIIPQDDAARIDSRGHAAIGILIKAEGFAVRPAWDEKEKRFVGILTAIVASKPVDGTDKAYTQEIPLFRLMEAGELYEPARELDEETTSIGLERVKAGSEAPDNLSSEMQNLVDSHIAKIKGSQH